MTPTGRPSKPLSERFWPKVEMIPFHDCWEWIGATNKDGYGQLILENRKHASAHRVSWEMANGTDIPEGMFICHACDNPPCVNPKHLFVGSHADNMEDMALKGRCNVGISNRNARLSEREVIAIRKAYADGGITQKELGAKFGLGAPHVCRIINRKRWVRL